jgi:hypothetical protein
MKDKFKVGDFIKITEKAQGLEKGTICLITEVVKDLFGLQDHYYKLYVPCTKKKNKITIIWNGGYFKKL